MPRLFALLFIISASIAMTGCNEVNSDRIPYADVYVDLTYNWNIYGVHSMGEYKYFIRSNDLAKREPRDFPFNANTRTGFGGLLLTCDAENHPLVYDLACPFERKSNIIVRVLPDNSNVVECPQCHSRYNVTEFFGSAIDGPAKTHRYGLTRYNAYPNQASLTTGYTLRR